MKVKVQLRDTIKKIDLKKANNYEQFKALIKKSFKELNDDDYFFYYYDQDSDRLNIDDEQSFAQYIEQENKAKMFIKLPGQNFQDQSLDKSISSNVLTNSLTKTQSEDNQLTQSNATRASAKEGPNKFKKTQAVKQQKINTTVHRGIYCYHCKSLIVGIRWKCLDQIDKDVCNKCKEKFNHKENDLLKIQTQDYLLKINYLPSIYKLFNPNLQQSSSDKQVKPWIKDQDIAQGTPDAVKHIWQASAQLAREVASGFENWQKEYQRKTVK